MNNGGFFRGMITGAVVGVTAIKLLDQVSPRQRRRFQRRASNMFRNMGSVVDGIISIRK